MISTRPSPSRRRSASRTGERLTPARRATSLSVRRLPGVSSPLMIRSASQSATVRESSLCSAGCGGSWSSERAGGSIMRQMCCVLYTERHPSFPVEGVTLKVRIPLVFFLLPLPAGGAGPAAALAGHSSHRAAAATPKRGGSITIARIEDSQSFDKTNVFQNESIWLAEQIMEPLYTVTADGKGVKPWLATSYTQSNGGKTYTFKLRKGVKFSNGKAMTAADVKFSIDDARAQSKGWGYLDAAIKNITAPNPNTVVFNLKYKWAPFLPDIALFANGIIPNHFAGRSRTAFYKHPIGTGPFMWDKRVVGQSVTFKRNPFYGKRGKPYLDSVTWTFITDENTRELQLRGNQIQVDEFPPFNSISKLQHTSGVTMSLFPSTRTDYLDLNEKYPPLADVHVRRAISYAIDRQAIVKS